MLRGGVKCLIDNISKKINARKIIFCGSSKGGWASLNFGFDIDFPEKVIICGAPQYFLGNYLKNFHATFSYIRQENDADQVIQELNIHLKNKIFSSASAPKIFIHYSVNDHTYEEHINALLSDLHMRHIEIVEDMQEYINHFDVSLYFPDFLQRIISQEIS